MYASKNSKQGNHVHSYKELFNSLLWVLCECSQNKSKMAVSKDCGYEKLRLLILLREE